MKTFVWFQIENTQKIIQQSVPHPPGSPTTPSTFQEAADLAGVQICVFGGTSLAAFSCKGGNCLAEKLTNLSSSNSDPSVTEPLPPSGRLKHPASANPMFWASPENFKYHCKEVGVLSLKVSF